MAIDFFLRAIDEIRQWLGRRRVRRDGRLEKSAGALGLLHRAAVATRAYIADVDADRRRKSRSKEHGLALAWVEAGEALAGIDDPQAQELFRRMFRKALYWADPSEWDEDRIAEAGIGLDALVADVGAVLERVRDA